MDDGKAKAEVEITPEMIEAGEAALYERTRFLAIDPDGVTWDEDFRAGLVRDVFLAMRARSRETFSRSLKSRRSSSKS